MAHDGPYAELDGVEIDGVPAPCSAPFCIWGVCISDTQGFRASRGPISQFGPRIHDSADNPSPTTDDLLTRAERLP